MRNRQRRKSRIKEVVVSYINKNSKEFLAASIVFIVGIILSILFINKVNDGQINNISDYINQFINVIKNGGDIDKLELLKNVIRNNLILCILLWIIGSTIIGMPILYAVIAFKGFCLGYTISILIKVLGSSKGIVFAISSILLQNIIIIPCILAMAVSGIKLHNSIIKDKRRDNIKMEIYKHTIFCFIISLFIILSSFVEVYISTNMMIIYIKYLQI